MSDTTSPLERTDTINLSGDATLLLVVVGVVAAVFVMYLVLDYVIHRRRDKRLRERWKSAGGG